jgi:CelD/BcsL family acetyltransferase involved in cellulose biosynthesis
MNQWQVTRLDKSLGAHAAAWDALNQRLFNGHPMLGRCFVESLLKHFGDGTEHLCVLAPNGAPEAMCLLKPAGFGIWRTFLPSQAQLSPVLILKMVDLTGLINSLPGFVIRLDFLCNDPQFGDLATGSYATSNRMDHALTMSISLKDGFEAYWGSRSKNLTKNIGRYARRLADDGIAHKFLCITAPEHIGSAVARYADLESKGWKSDTNTAIAQNNTQGLFYTDLLNNMSATGGAMVCELWFNDQLAASRLMIVGNSMAIILKTTYDETLKQYAPGRLLLRDVIEAMCVSHTDKALEFYTDANPDQLAWATGQRWITHWSFYKHKFAADLFSVISAARKTLGGSESTGQLAGSGQSVDVFRHPDQLPADVQQLFEDTEHDNFQCGVPWYKNLADAVYSEDSGLHIYVLRREGRPIAALPIVVTKGKLGWHIEALSNYYTSLYAPAITSGVKYRDFAPLISAVLQAHAPVASMRFEPMDPDAIPYRRLWKALQANGLATFKFFCFGNWYLSRPGTWQNYLLGRDGKLRSNIKRMTSKFLGAGGTLELITGGAELERGLAAYEKVYAMSWKRPEPYPTFMPGLIRTSAARGWLRLGVAWLDGTPIAAQVWIVANGKANIYKLAYDEAYKVHGSGTVLTAKLMEHAIEKDDVDEVDYLTGDDPYKKSWMSDRRERWGIIAYNPKTLGGILGLVKEILGRILKSVKAKSQPEITQKAK